MFVSLQKDITNSGTTREPNRCSWKRSKSADRRSKERDPYVAYTLNCLAEMYCLTGRYVVGEARQLEAVGTQRTPLREDQPEFAWKVNNSAVLWG